MAKLEHPDLGAHLLGANPVQAGRVPLRLMVYEDDDLSDDIYRSASSVGATERVNSRRIFLWSFLLIPQKKAKNKIEPPESIPTT